MTKGTDSAMPLIATELGCEGDKGDYHTYSDVYSNGGLTKREMFAAMAMQGLIQRQELIPRDADIICPLAAVYADALIEALNAKD